MPAIRPDVDPDGLYEYSVVYTDRALNHMSSSFQSVMKDLSAGLKGVYAADSVAIVPGSGTFAMEAVARQFARGKRCLVIRNGWFSYRWSQILEMGNLSSDIRVLKAQREREGDTEPFVPYPLEEALNTIRAEQPDILFAPHVETAAGMMLPDDYIRGLASAMHDHGGLFVLDCIASGTVWVDMANSGVDVLISAPQKGWSSPPCCGLVMLNRTARARVNETESDSFAANLKSWLGIMEAYEGGGHAYHATMPTDALRAFRNVMQETRSFGFDLVKQRQLELGEQVRSLLRQKGITSVAAEGFGAPGVVVSYTADPEIKSGKRFGEQGLQIAAGVPLMCDEGEQFSTFRLGLFGLDKLGDIDRTMTILARALERIF